MKDRDYTLRCIEYFKHHKKLHENQLKFWQAQKPGKRYSEYGINEECRYQQEAIRICEDAIKVFTKIAKGSDEHVSVQPETLSDVH